MRITFKKYDPPNNFFYVHRDGEYIAHLSEFVDGWSLWLMTNARTPNLPRFAVVFEKHKCSKKDAKEIAANMVRLRMEKNYEG